MTTKAKRFTVTYRPDFVSTYPLGTFDNEPDALAAAAGYAKMYYGEISPITVRDGKRIVHTIPQGSGR